MFENVRGSHTVDCDSQVMRKGLVGGHTAFLYLIFMLM